MKMETQGFPLPSAHTMHIFQNCFTTQRSENYMDWKLLIMVKAHTSNVKMTAMKNVRECLSPDALSGTRRVLKHSRFDVFMVDLGV